MGIDYETLINEWFAKLPNGYAVYPYSPIELYMLNEVLREYGLKEVDEDEMNQQPNSQSNADDAPKQNMDIPDGEDDSRFHTKTADFMDNVQSFIKYITSNYGGGVSMSGLDRFYKKLITLPKEQFQNVGKIIHTGTNRIPSNGTFQLGKYENILKKLINSTVRVEGGSSNQLFLAIIYDGKMLTVNGYGDVSPSVKVPGIKGLMLQTADTQDIVNFGNLSVEASDMLSKLLELYSIMNNVESKENFTAQQLTGLLKELASPEAAKEFNDIIDMAQTSTVKTVADASKRVMNILGGSDTRSLVVQFINALNRDIQMKLNTISHWIAIPTRVDKVYVGTSVEIYYSLKSRVNPIKISNVITNISVNNLQVRGDMLIKEILK